jgi:cation:H+ antiporter
VVYVLGLIGLVLLLWGGDRLVISAVSLSHRFGVSALVTGIIVVGLGTSLPELVTSLDAALQGSTGLAVGNVIGSNIANILLVLGLCALCFPLQGEPSDLRRDLASLVLASALTIVVLHQGTIGRWAGLWLTAGLVLHLGVLLVTASRSPANQTVTPAMPIAGTIYRDLFAALVAIIVLIAGAHLLVNSALEIARAYGVSESLLGLTLLALGTSLPELAIALVAVVRRHGDVAIGNIVGSTLFNLLGILGITALVTPLSVPADIVRFDVWVMLAAMLVLALFARTGWRITRVEGGMLLLGYPIYLSALLT